MRKSECCRLAGPNECRRRRNVAHLASLLLGGCSPSLPSSPHYSRCRPSRLIFRDKATRTTQWHRARPTIGATDGRTDGRTMRPSLQPPPRAAQSESQIRPRREGRERKPRRRRRGAPTRRPKLRLRCAAPPPQSVFASASG